MLEGYVRYCHDLEIFNRFARRICQVLSGFYKYLIGLLEGYFKYCQDLEILSKYTRGIH